MKKYNYNFSIITPGGCSSSCSFCTNPYNEKWSKEYIQNLTKIIFNSSLSTVFNQVSVTGGEPTQSPVFRDIIQLLYTDSMMYRPRFKKRVLTTNGWKLGEYIEQCSEVFHHVNISRHGIGDTENFTVFGGKNIATDLEIMSYCNYFGKKGIDVNLNHVYTLDSAFDMQYLFEYIKYAQSLNATKITFRYDQNTNQMTPSYLEQLVISNDYTVIEEGGCPVCREACYLINGMYVTFKNSCAEPTKELGGELYELVYHPDGKLYKDWDKKFPYKHEQPIIVQKKQSVIVDYSYSSGGGGNTGYSLRGCGSGGCI